VNNSRTSFDSSPLPFWAKRSADPESREMFQILYSSWSVIRIPNHPGWQKKYFFS